MFGGQFDTIIRNRQSLIQRCYRMVEKPEEKIEERISVNR